VSIGHEVEPAAIVSAAPLVRNALPRGASWDGNEDQYADEKGYRELLSEGEPVAQGSTAR